MVAIPFHDTLVQGVFLERLNRFVLECELPSGSIEKVHLPDPGRLKDLLVPGGPIWLQESKDPKRKTKWSAVMTYDRTNDIYVSLNTQYPNRLVLEALRLEILEELKDWRLEKAEHKVGGSRFDFLLTHKRNDDTLLLEVKSVTMAEDGMGKFPDAVTARGARHVEELTHLQMTGNYQTAVLFIAQRTDLRGITSASEIDPHFARVMEEAANHGVRFFGRSCNVTPERISLNGSIPVYTKKD
ncbi:DNA/RNA nuclease SfsA [Bacillus sp. AFS015802]|uniref:DNA/RNA nuclease SfsA n=1 Tax=Bacillus sp. AFS015802 TaxID=2033486 RepID=UPI000BF99D88|nr:DNA/RNA nuclease SfsA [Bacillus sp. AFS015802]PFA68664.1 DNA/RNA nuclease SfsA [Bacillus sp. AFS015802]